MQMQTKKANKQIGVVAGILEQNNQYLLCQRPKGKICENFWEFPGGKIEPNETPLDAICRELSEELKITINRQKTYFWFCKDFVYTHAAVKLHFFRISQWQGEITLENAEHQALSWQSKEFLQPTVSPLLPANFEIIKALALPEIALICENSADKIIAFLENLKNQQNQQNQQFLIIFREKSTKIFGEKIRKLQDFYQQLQRLNLLENIIFSINISNEQDLQLFSQIPQNFSISAHLSADFFINHQNSLPEIKQKYSLLWLGVSTHTAEDLAKIKEINQRQNQNQTIIDYAFLSPIFPTKTHPEISAEATLGIKNFKNLVKNFATTPIFALGGLSLQKDLENIKTAGGHGIATISGI